MLLNLYKKRSVVWPNSGFKEQLRMFEKLLIENDYNIDKINFKEIKWAPPENMPSYLVLLIFY